MVKNLILHLGDTKTGSTALQNVLKTGQYDLPGHSVFYSGEGRQLNQNHLARALTRKSQFGQRAMWFKKAYTGLQDSGADYGIVSAEHFQGVDPVLLRRVMERHWPDLAADARLIAYVRPHAEKLLSIYSEQMKFGADLGHLEARIDQISRNGTLDYAPRFQKWRSVFGDRFELRPLVRATLYRQDIVADFFQFLIGDDIARLPDVTSANASLTVSQIALLRVFLRHLPQGVGNGKQQQARAALSRMVTRKIRKSGLGQASGRMHFPPSLMDQVVNRYQDDAAALDVTFFSGDPMSRALSQAAETLSGPEQSLDADSYFSPEIIVGFELLAQVLGEFLLKDPRLVQSVARGIIRKKQAP